MENQPIIGVSEVKNGPGTAIVSYSNRVELFSIDSLEKTDSYTLPATRSILSRAVGAMDDQGTRQLFAISDKQTFCRIFPFKENKKYKIKVLGIESFQIQGKTFILVLSKASLVLYDQTLSIIQVLPFSVPNVISLYYDFGPSGIAIFFRTAKAKQSVCKEFSISSTCIKELGSHDIPIFKREDIVSFCYDFSSPSSSCSFNFTSGKWKTHQLTESIQTNSKFFNPLALVTKDSSSIFLCKDTLAIVSAASNSLKLSIWDTRSQSHLHSYTHSVQRNSTDKIYALFTSSSTIFVVGQQNSVSFQVPEWILGANRAQGVLAQTLESAEWFSNSSVSKKIISPESMEAFEKSFFEAIGKICKLDGGILSLSDRIVLVSHELVHETVEQLQSFPQLWSDSILDFLLVNQLVSCSLYPKLVPAAIRNECTNSLSSIVTHVKDLSPSQLVSILEYALKHSATQLVHTILSAIISPTQLSAILPRISHGSLLALLESLNVILPQYSLPDPPNSLPALSHTFAWVSAILDAFFTTLLEPRFAGPLSSLKESVDSLAACQNTCTQLHASLQAALESAETTGQRPTKRQRYEAEILQIF